MAQTTIVALETSTEACSVAVYREGQMYHRTEEAPRRHTARLLPLLEVVMEEAGITGRTVSAVAYGRGPGAFAGVRLAASVAQGLCLAWSLPALPVSTLQALAQGAYRRHGAKRVLAALDARMGQVYWGAFIAEEGGGMRLQQGEGAAAPERVHGGGPAWMGIGRGFAAYPQTLPSTGAGREPDTLPDARDLLPGALADWQAGQLTSPEAIQPTYLREGV
ncbi:MAG: tRNA (adenosine(37)-N6)-threonylcarbamoyltransferase complex dimerization subunit type 1 TsaB [Halorhodospira sp.]